MLIAAIANAARRIEAPRPIVRCGRELVGERMDFIIHAPMSLFGIFYSEILDRRHPMKIATIGLQWNPKPKMMRTVEIIAANIFAAVEAAASRDDKRIIQMINTFKRALNLASCLSVAALFATAALAQAPSQAQRDAIKAQCRSDYMAHCSSIPPGGEASLQCLQKNMSSLSSSCQTAVRAVEAPAAATAKPADTAAPKAAAPAAAATAAPKTAAAAPAGQPSSAQISAIRSACRSDYPKVCAGVPTGGAPALQCLEKNKAKLSAGCEKAVSAAGGGAATAAAPAAGAAPPAAGTAPAAAPTVIVLRPMRPREELFVLRSACGADVRTICGGVPPGGGRIIQCLATNAAQLSPACKDVLSPFAAQ